MSNPPRRIPTDIRPVPGIVQRGINFAKATIEHVKKGSPLVTDVEVEQRYNICQSCTEYFKQTAEGEGTCLHPKCGCSMRRAIVRNKLTDGPNKLRWAEQKCPIGKWGPIEPKAEASNELELRDHNGT